MAVLASTAKRQRTEVRLNDLLPEKKRQFGEATPAEVQN